MLYKLIRGNKLITGLCSVQFDCSFLASFPVEMIIHLFFDSVFHVDSLVYQ